MYDVVRNGKQRQDDYTRIKKTIQEIVGMSKSKKKKQKPQDRNENLMKQFFAFQNIQKKLTEATFGDADKNKKITKPEDVRTSLEGSDCDNGSMPSCSNSRAAAGKSYAKERAKRDEYNTDELSDSLSSGDPQRDDVTDGTDSGESEAEIASYKIENESKASSGSSTNGKVQNDSSSVQRFKKKSVLSPSELAIIKDLCRDLIKKEEKATEDAELKLESPETKTKKYEQIYEEEVCSEKQTEKSINSEQIKMKNEEYKMEKGSADQRDIVQIEIRGAQKDNIELEEIKNWKNKPKTENILILDSVNLEPHIYDSASNEEIPESQMEQKINEISQCNNEEFIDTLLVKGKLTMISEHEEETITTNENFEMVHLEILTKETIQEVDEWKQSKKWSEEKVIIEKTVKVNGENKDVRETERNEEERNEGALCNMSDDDLIRKTMIEMEQIDQEFMIEKASPTVGEHAICHCSCAGDGDKQILEERINRLQEEILILREELEAAKRHNEEAAEEVEYISSMMTGRGSHLLRNGSDWDEWEVKEMVRERQEQKRLKAMQEYEAKLGVVEALCSAEMGKLQESLQTLLPLNATASGWDNPSEPVDISSRSSWQAQDYVFEVVTSMNLSSSDENGVSGTISTNCEQPSLSEWKAEGQ